MIVPSILGGCVLIGCVCGGVCCYYGVNRFLMWRANEKRLKPKKQTPVKEHKDKEAATSSSESDFDRSNVVLHAKR